MINVNEVTKEVLKSMEKYRKGDINLQEHRMTIKSYLKNITLAHFEGRTHDINGNQIFHYKVDGDNCITNCPTNPEYVIGSRGCEKCKNFVEAYSDAKIMFCKGEPI
jgi:hypothetical protein